MPTFRQYMEIDEVERERMFMEFCKKNNRKPTEDGIGDDFLDSITTEEDEQ
jgi:hypothetical protein